MKFELDQSSRHLSIRAYGPRDFVVGEPIGRVPA